MGCFCAVLVYGAAAEAELVTAYGAGEVPVLELKYGAALVGAFAPLEGGSEFGSLLALEFLDERSATVFEKFCNFFGSQCVARNGLE